MFNLVSKKITGIPDASGWSQSYDFVPNDEETKKLRGHLFVILSTSKVESSVESISTGRIIFNEIQQNYFDELEIDAFSKIKSVSKAIKDKFELSLPNLEIGIMVFVDNVCYVVASGGVNIYILRGNSLAEIISSNSNELASASGHPQENDTLVLANSKFISSVSQEEIKNAIKENKVDDMSSSFQETGRHVANFIKFSQNVFPTDYVSELPQITDVSSNLQNRIEDTKKTFTSLFERLSRTANRVVPQKNIYIKDSVEFEAESQNKKLTLSVGVILLLILTVSIFFGIKQKNSNETKSMYEGKLVEANRDLDEAIGLVSVSPEEARKLFVSAQEKLFEIESFQAKDPKIDELKQRIEDQKGLAFGEYKVETTLFTDLTLLSSGFKGDMISSSEGNLFVLDKTGKKMVSLEIDTKKSRVVAGPDKIDTEVVDIASYSDRVFILDNDGIKEIDSEVSTVINKDWEGEALIYGFAGNIYVLDKTANLIYRYSGNGDTFGSKQNWLSSSTKPDFSNSKSWIIDGSVYVLNANERIQKFSLGSPQAFGLSGVYPEIESIDAIYSSDETEFVYILDKSGSRVVVMDKKGSYKAQYMSNEISNAKGLVVSEEEGKIILLTGEKLVTIEIKN